MTKKASKQSKRGKGKTGKLKLNKETLKDLDASDPSELKGGMMWKTKTCDGYMSCPPSCGPTGCICQAKA